MLKPEYQDAKSYKNAQCEQCTIEYVLKEETSVQEETSSNQEQDDEVVIQSPQLIQPSISQIQAMKPMYTANI